MRCVVVPESDPGARAGYAQILAVHAALLHTGKILYFSGDEHDPGRHHVHLFDHARLFDCATLAVSTPAPAPGIRDLFCCGHAFLADGRLLVAGGTEAWTTEVMGGDPHGHAAAGHFRGTAEAYVFDPESEQWAAVHRMSFEPGRTTGGGRWYPTLCTLGTGGVVALSGHPTDADSRHYNDSVEVFSPAPAPAGSWSVVGTLPAALPGYPMLTYYPRVHLLPNGKLFFASPVNGQSVWWDPHTFAFTPLGGGPGNEYDGIGVTSVLLPLLPEDGYRPRVLVCNRAQPKRIDLGATSPSWQPTGARTLLVGGAPPERTHANAVLLPTGDVALVGGVRDPIVDPGSAVLDVELYRDATNSWVTLPAGARASVPRNYHSVALLMPDGRVWMAGSNVRANWSFHNSADYPAALPTDAQQGSVDNRERRIELFEPWYYGRPDRPTLSISSADVSVGGSFRVDTPQAATISRVAIVRAGSVTHSFNSDQRYVGLPFTHTGTGTLEVSVPDNENLVPPGSYLLFVLNQVVDPGTGAVLDVPSIGHFVRIDNAKLFKELKPELDIVLKEFELFPKLKDAELDPLGILQHVGDPAPWVKLMAQRVDDIERRMPRAKAFISAKQRPLTAPQPLVRDLAAERSAPPTEEELIMRDPHRHEGRPEHGNDHGQAPGGPAPTPGGHGHGEGHGQGGHGHGGHGHHGHGGHGPGEPPAS